LIKQLVILLAVFAQAPAYSATWCDFNNFDVVVAGSYVAVHGSSLDANGKHVYLGDLRTEKGRAIQALLLTAAIAGKNVRYGHNGQNYICGELPAYNTVTANPEYLHILTKK
jgi:hypothetical protein